MTYIQHAHPVGHNVPDNPVELVNFVMRQRRSRLIQDQ